VITSLLLASLLGAQAPAAQPQAEDHEDEIVVLGRRLANLRVRTSSSDGKCTVERSSGDRDFDVATCIAMERCWPAAAAKASPSADRRLPRPEREQILLAAREAANACVFPLRERLLEQMAETSSF
jgi:hypothetical protein